MRRYKATISEAVASHNFTLAFGQFLDDFRNSTDEEKQKLIAYEPKRDGVDLVILCHAAAAVHKLANDNDLDVPKWVHDPVYTMPEPFYAHNVRSEEFQRYLFESSPPEYAIRNIFFGDNVLQRV
jgi:hypothetical protein